MASLKDALLITCATFISEIGFWPETSSKKNYNAPLIPCEFVRFFFGTSFLLRSLTINSLSASIALI